MRRIKGIVFGLIIGIPLGLWFGFNIGKDRPLLSNPFEEVAFQEKIKETGGSLMEKSGEVLEKSGQALQKKAQESEPPVMPSQYQPPASPSQYQSPVAQVELPAMSSSYSPAWSTSTKSLELKMPS